MRIPEPHDHVDPLSFPLLLLAGRPLGWTTTLGPSEMHRSAAATANSVLFTPAQAKGNSKILPHAGGRLFQQYCVVLIAKQEAIA